jgi:ABC-type antimicrobial peptide transport system permease subunit
MNGSGYADGWQQKRPRRATLGVGLIAGLLGIGAVLGFASIAGATTVPPALTLRAEQAPGDPQAVELTASLVQTPGSSVQPGSLAGDSVNFSVHLDEFAGAPLLALGSATTDATGTATMTYRPTWTGRQALTATVTDASGNTLGSAVTNFTADSADRPFVGTIEAARPDGTIGQAVAGVLIALVVILWVTLIAVVVRVRFGIAALSR